MVFNTPLTRLLGIRTPVVGAAMAKASGGALAAGVSNAGGFGFLSAGYLDKEAVFKELALARSLITRSNEPNSRLPPFGVGFFGWELEQKEGAVDILKAVLHENVGAIWISFGKDIGRWVRLVREYDATSGRDRTIVFVQVNTTSEAVTACRDWDIDVLVLQGTEAGGHGSGDAPPLISLLPSVLRVVPNPPPILAAGGLSTGSHLAALLTLGASGIVVGTRLLLTPQSLFSTSKKEELVDIKPEQDHETIRSAVFDDLLGVRQNWPEGITARGLKKQAILEDERSGLALGERRKRYDAGKGSGESHEIIWAGSSVALAPAICSAEDIIRELHKEGIEALGRASTLIQKQ